MSKYISFEDALKKAQRYCAYQDRCHQEVRRKLKDLGVYGEDLGQIMVLLVEENFLNEERFARSYARGKFRMKRWGRNRILKELKQRAISDYCIRKAMEEIDPEEYEKTLISVLEKRHADKPNIVGQYKVRQDLIKYGLSRGYESALVIPIASKNCGGSVWANLNVLVIPNTN